MANGMKMKAYLLFAHLPKSSLTLRTERVNPTSADVNGRFSFGCYMAFEAGFMVPVDYVIYI